MRFHMHRRLGLAVVAAAIGVIGTMVVGPSPANAAPLIIEIRAQHSNKVLSATPTSGGPVREGNPIVQRTAIAFDQRQQWEVISQPVVDGKLVRTYMLRQSIVDNNGVLVRGCIDAPNDNQVQANNTPVVVRPCDGSASQRWILIPNDPSPSFQAHRNLWNNMQWAVANASTLENAPLVQFNQNGGTNHKFKETFIG